eukprot:3748185-Prymnesium_polylepis.1
MPTAATQKETHQLENTHSKRAVAEAQQQQCASADECAKRQQGAKEETLNTECQAACSRVSGRSRATASRRPQHKSWRGPAVGEPEYHAFTSH